MKVTRIFDILTHYQEKYPTQECALASKIDGVWQKIGIQAYIKMVDDISYGLLHIGVKKGDNIGIISGNRPEWNMVDFAIMQVGAVSIPIYPTISQEDYKHILNHSEMKIAFVEGEELLKRVEPVRATLSTLEQLYTFDQTGGADDTLKQLIQLGQENPQKEALNSIKAHIGAEELATIIYTSGTTGVQKGVMLSHSNITQQLHALQDIPSTWSKTAFSFLPLCHAYERMMVYLYQFLGMSVYYAESLATIGENIKEINPTMMTCVPRVLERIYDKIYLKGKNLPQTQKSLYYWAFRLATQYQLEGMSLWQKLQLKIADKLIFKKWREAIGGNFDIVVSGGSAIQPHIASFFSAIGLPVFEGYGLSETSPVIAVSQRVKNGRKFGSVGLPLPGIEVKLGKDDEIICRGHNVMMGYYKDPKLTEEVIDKEGWFHTGDIGKITSKGQLIITGRLKNLFKTSFGKYVNPMVIEAKFTESPLIEHLIVLGENEKFAAALIRPDFNYLQSWCKSNNIPYKSPTEVIQHPTIIQRYGEEVREYNKQFGDYEQIKKFLLVSEEWSTENNFLSPTLKTKRQVVTQFYQKTIDKLFEHHNPK